MTVSEHYLSVTHNKVHCEVCDLQLEDSRWHGFSWRKVLLIGTILGATAGVALYSYLSFLTINN